MFPPLVETSVERLVLTESNTIVIRLSALAFQLFLLGLTITDNSEQKFFLIFAIYLKLRPFS